MGKTSTEVKNRYNKKAYDTITLKVKSGQREIIQAQAKSMGMSTNEYIRDLIYIAMDSTDPLKSE